LRAADETLIRLGEAMEPRYEILGRVGGGGMAEVYLARHRGHGGFCAVKVLSESLGAEPALVEAFLQEARTAATLHDHPNIVQIVDVDSHPDFHYLVMQYVEGEDLSTYLRRVGKLSWEETVYVVCETAKALAWAHDRSVVHRDIKPGNVRLTPSGRVVVLDFGISKVGRMPSSLTRVGLRSGTPRYMSPEQFAGEAVDQRSDLYSLGVVAYECLTGRRPFDGDSEAQIRRAQMSPPEPPSQIVPEISPDLSEIVMRLLNSDPGQRISSSHELVLLLDLFGISKKPSSLRPQASNDLDRLRDQPTSPIPQTTRPNASPPTPTPAAPPSLAPSPAAEPPRTNLYRDDWKRWVGWAGAFVAAFLCAAYFLTRPPRPAQTDSSSTASTPNTTPPPLPELLESPAGDMTLVRSASGDAAFYLDRTEATRSSYRAFCAATGHALPDLADEAGPGSDQLPVVNVSYEDAEAFCRWAGKRLPTEPEWMRAAGAGDERPYPWGNAPPTPRLVNAAGDSDGYAGPSPAGAFPEGAGPYGSLDLAGNVWELTATPYDPGDLELKEWLVIPGADTARWVVIKGGAFDRPADDPDFRGSARRGLPVFHRFGNIGFRCARDPEP
jgi:serine/threonine-protein kinase